MTKIVSLTAESFKRLKAVHIEPDGNLVVIAGRNAQGKSSVLDAIWAALAGAAGAKSLDRPIRDGEESATVTVELDEIVVTRRWTAKGTSLTVTGKDGHKYSKPQAMLDDLIGRLSFDPLAFAQMKPADQRAALLSIVDLPFDPDALEADRKEAYDARTQHNREVKAAQARLDGVVPPGPTTPDAPVDIAALAQEFREAESAYHEVDALRGDVATIDAEIERLQEQRSLLIQKGHAAVAKQKTMRDPGVINAELERASEINAAVARKQQHAALAADLDAAREAAAAADAEIARIDRRKAEGLAAAKMPVAGLGFDDEGVTFNGVPFSQASAAERLKVSVAMAMAMNPSVRVICIRDASLLDAQNMSALAAFAERSGYQLWVERVDTADGVGIVIEDGEVSA